MFIKGKTNEKLRVPGDSHLVPSPRRPGIVLCLEEFVLNPPRSTAVSVREA